MFLERLLNHFFTDLSHKSYIKSKLLKYRTQTFWIFKQTCYFCLMLVWPAIIIFFINWRAIVKYPLTEQKKQTKTKQNKNPRRELMVKIESGERPLLTPILASSVWSPQRLLGLELSSVTWTGSKRAGIITVFAESGKKCRLWITTNAVGWQEFQ